MPTNPCNFPQSSIIITNPPSSYPSLATKGTTQKNQQFAQRTSPFSNSDSIRSFDSHHCNINNNPSTCRFKAYLKQQKTSYKLHNAIFHDTTKLSQVMFACPFQQLCSQTSLTSDLSCTLTFAQLSFSSHLFPVSSEIFSISLASKFKPFVRMSSRSSHISISAH